MSFFIVLLIPALIIGWTASETSRDKMQEQMLGSAEQSVETVNLIISNAIQAKMHDADYLTSIINASMIDGPRSPRIVPSLEQYLGMHADANDIYIGTKEGLMIRGKAKDDSSYDPRERDWYKLAMKTPGKIAMTPIIINTSGKPALVMSKTLPDGSGVLGISLNLDVLSAQSSIHIGDKGYVVVLDGAKKVIVHPDLKPADEAGKSYADPMFAEPSGIFDYDLGDNGKKMVFQTNEATGWKIGGSLYEEELNEGADAIQRIVTITIVVILLVLIAACSFLVNSITRPLLRLQESAAVISKGDLTALIDTRKQDEIGNVARSFQSMVDNLRAMIMGVQETTELVSSSAEELAASAEQSSHAIEHVSGSVQEMAAGSEQQVGSVQQGAQSLTNISAEIQNLSGQMQEMSSGMQQTSASAHEGNQAAMEAAQQIYSVQETVGRLDGIVNKLGERSLEIDNIVEVITNISQQTNLLALNASIEAARAGEQGRGFAVVASEVRKLAFNSEQSAFQISELVQAVRMHVEEVAAEMVVTKTKVESGIEAVNISGRSFSEITRTVEHSASTLEELANAAQEMNGNAAAVVEHMNKIKSISEHASEITDSVSAATQQQQASTEEIASSAAGLSSMAEQLQQLVLRFKIYHN
ncbi:methyl-accepting chemotaxis protein [Paenibacillus donghaensis]|uniref:methyl-accepting chemotaxis protein n=1 Tax=Paenibacillus donghaensis TaxID=414771 RepID=UPI0014725035|nr:methyl-accepting chemotaxis protein [Paenibacillus donghaensis]